MPSNIPVEVLHYYSQSTLHGTCDMCNKNTRFVHYYQCEVVSTDFQEALTDILYKSMEILGSNILLCRTCKSNFLQFAMKEFPKIINYAVSLKNAKTSEKRIANIVHFMTDELIADSKHDVDPEHVNYSSSTKNLIREQRMFKAMCKDLYESQKHLSGYIETALVMFLGEMLNLEAYGGYRVTSGYLTQVPIASFNRIRKQHNLHTCINKVLVVTPEQKKEIEIIYYKEQNDNS